MLHICSRSSRGRIEGSGRHTDASRVSFTTLCGALPDYALPATARAQGRLLRQRILSRVLNGTLTRNPQLTVLARLNGKKIELPYGHSPLNFLAERPLYESEFNRLLFGVDEAGGKTSLDALQTYTVGRKYAYWNVIGFHADDVAAARAFIAAEKDFFAHL